MTRARVWSIGHGAQSIDRFLATLDGAGIRRLIDVRIAPGSRRHPQFGRDALASSLGDLGIGYDWKKALGGFRKPRADSPNTAIRNVSFRGYADYMSTDEFRSALTDLEEIARDRPTAYMCAETPWQRCHRRMISDALTVDGWAVTHLLAPSREEPHVLHPAARVERGRLIYDVA
jgi:uncharacterized protein (DUF488 family)